MSSARLVENQDVSEEMVKICSKLAINTQHERLFFCPNDMLFFNQRKVCFVAMFPCRPGERTGRGGGVYLGQGCGTRSWPAWVCCPAEVQTTVTGLHSWRPGSRQCRSFVQYPPHVALYQRQQRTHLHKCATLGVPSIMNRLVSPFHTGCTRASLLGAKTHPTTDPALPPPAAPGRPLYSP